MRITTEFMWISQFSRSVVSDSLRPHESQHARPPCPSPTPGVHSNSCPSSWWCHPAISASVIPFSSCPQSLPESESFPRSQLFAWGGQSIGVSALASFLPKNTQDWSLLECTGWISLQSKGLSRVSSLHEVAKVLEFQLQHQSFQRTPRADLFRMDWLDLLAVQGTLKSLSNTTVQKHQFFSAQLSSQSNSHIHTWPLEKP